ncbi:hypothetical protein ABFS82_06G188700 [Erythranthe guttata]
MMKILFFVFLATSFSHALAQEKRRCAFTPKITVRVVNNLPPNSQPLAVHCASKDDDLGYHTLGVGEDFSWNFCNNIWGNSLFFCHLWVDRREKAFDSFRAEFIIGTPPNKYFQWSAQDDGIYFSHNDSPFTKKFKWDFNA